MRRARFKVPPDRPVGYYHCISRCVEGRFVFRDVESEHFLKLMREFEEFCEVRVLTFCLMSNHFHILLEVPKRPDILPGAEAILSKLERLTGFQDPGTARQELELYRRMNDVEAEKAWLERYYRRMWDVSAFMKLLKQRFSQWYNRRAERKGTLWQERFKSVLVDGAGDALTTIAAYIDLNPVRAGIVKDPKDYRWSGYGEAVAGQDRAGGGLQFIVRALQGGAEASIGKSLELYRMFIFQEGSEEREGRTEEGTPSRGALKRAEVLRVIQEKGRLPVSDYLRCRVRYFCDGAVLGSKGYVDEVFKAYRERFGEKRKTGARRLRGLEEPLYALRDLRLKVFG